MSKNKKTVILVRAFCTEFEVVCNKYPIHVSEDQVDYIHHISIEQAIKYVHKNVVETAMVILVNHLSEDDVVIDTIVNENYKSPEVKL